MFRIVTIFLCIIASSLVASFDLFKVIDNALEVKILPDGSFKVGLLTIPVNTLCQLPLFITQRLTCHICAADCTVVHNRYSGQCGTYPGKNGHVCVCNDTPPADGRVPTTVEQCGPLTSADIPIVSYFVNRAFLRSTFDTIFIAFDNLVLCPADGIGCKADCVGNHQYDTGICRVNKPVQLAHSDISDDPQQFCECEYFQ